ncbi:hypothetical protein ALC57_10098 [Trachymyrmex cornetzi]|uniref:Uncharacterized protein n=1 Tax=Trachymyrmex cornetzi TaxID=471704 RepID=A0A195DYP6_9HYME|nr:hypothetical protein ALC57_10098 [Trachymyrmex cornetzi]
MGRGYIIPALRPSAFAFENKMRKYGTLIAPFGRAIINVEIFDAFGGRSTMAQEVSKSTEVRYTTLQLRAHASMQFTRTRGRLNCQLRDSINNATQRRIPPSRVPRFSFYQRP